MEEKQENTLYDDYKFLTEEEMERLGLSEYKTSDAVRTHLHGYVIRYDLLPPFHNVSLFSISLSIRI